MSNFLSENINAILSIARLAPSVHNTQPWKVNVKEDRLLIEKEPSRVLSHGDPAGRQTIISLGIFAEACVIGLEANGLNAAKVSMLADGKIEIITEPSKKSSGSQADVKALKQRFTDRSVYNQTAVKDSQKARLDAAWNTGSVKIKTVDSEEIINRSAVLTRQGLLLALSSPDFRNELSDYLVSGNKPYGIPTSTLSTGRLRTLFAKKLVSSGASRKHEADLEFERWSSAGALVFVLSSGDTPPFWLESGRAYLRASLEIQKLGFRQATSAAIVEASDFHEDIEKLLGTNMRIQCLLRIGHSDAPARHSSRYQPEELLAT